MIKILSTLRCACWKPFIPGCLSSAAVQGNNFRSMSRKIQRPAEKRMQSKVHNFHTEMEPQYARYDYVFEQAIDTRNECDKLRAKLMLKEELIKYCKDEFPPPLELLKKEK